MILGTVTDTPFCPTSFGLEYRVNFDTNPEAKSASGQDGPALSDQVYYPGDRVALEYRSTSSYGLWFIVGKVNQ
jgi:hypothetical protein